MDELTATRKIRACEGEAAAQVVLAHYAQAIRDKALEDAAAWLDAEADKQQRKWSEHLASGHGGPATSFHTIPRAYAEVIRALKGDTK